jgi:membrane fusion protein (multidrug efflux system)
MNASASSAASPLPHEAAREAAPARTQAPAKAKRSTRLRSIILGVIALALLGWGGHFAYHAYQYQETDDAYVTGHLHTISAQVSGQIKEVLVDDNQVVKRGDVLLRLDPLPYEIALERAKAALAQAEAQDRQVAAAANQADAALAEAKARVSQSEAQLVQTQAQLELANVTLTRNRQLLTENSAAQAEFDQARSAAQAAAAAHQGAQANLVAAQAAVNSAAAAQLSAHAQIEASHATVAAANAAVRDAERQLSYTTVTAPSDGRIGNRHVEPGNEVQAGQALLALAEPNAWVVANFKETQLARMHVGQDVELEVDALPGRTLHGRVDSFSPASGAQFALLPPDNATGNFNKVVQRVPVKITFDADSVRALGDRLRLGLSVVVNVRVR